MCKHTYICGMFSRCMNRRRTHTSYWIVSDLNQHWGSRAGCWGCSMHYWTLKLPVICGVASKYIGMTYKKRSVVYWTYIRGLMNNGCTFECSRIICNPLWIKRHTHTHTIGWRRIMCRTWCVVLLIHLCPLLLTINRSLSNSNETQIV